jgi:hypothetical protein
MSDNTLTGPPGPRATHALLGIIRTLADRSVQPDRDAMIAAIETVVQDVVALHDYVEVQEKNLHVRCVESLEDGREITRLRTALDTATRAVEALYLGESDELRAVSQRFAAVCTIRDTLIRANVGDHNIHLVRKPRTAANGS